MTRERADWLYFRAVRKAEEVFKKALDRASYEYARNVAARESPAAGIGNWNRHCLARMSRNGACTRAASSRT